MVKTGEWICKGWELVVQDLGMWVVLALIFGSSAEFVGKLWFR